MKDIIVGLTGQIRLIWPIGLAKIVAGVMAVAVVGCSTDFDPDVDATPVAVLNVLAEADSTVTASVSHSWLFGTEPGNVTVGNARVSLKVNGTLMGLMEFDGNSGKYVSPYRPVEGDEIEVSVRTVDYGDAVGATTVPRKVKIDRWECTPTAEIDYDGIIVQPDGSWEYNRTLKLNYSITFTDPAGEENYYMLSGKAYHWWGGGTCDDPILGENDSPLEAVFAKDNTFMVFSDRSIAGKSYTLSYTTTYSLDSSGYPGDIVQDENGDLHVYDRIALCSISREYYLYLLSLYKKYGELNSTLENLGFAEPKAIYTNVSPGVGIVGSQTADMIVNDVYGIIGEYGRTGR